MMKGGDNYVPKMTHFPKREAPIPKKPPPTTADSNLDSEIIPEPVPRKILLNSSKNDLLSKKRRPSGANEKKIENGIQPQIKHSEAKAKKIRKKSSEESAELSQPPTPLKSKIKPMPKIKNFRTLQKDIIPERLKMGRCRTVPEITLNH